MSLKDQLLKSGLVDNKRAKQAEKDRHKQIKQQKGGVVASDDVRAAAARAQAEKIERDRQLNQQQREAAERRAVMAQIRQLVALNRQPTNGEIAYHFSDGSQVKRIMVNDLQQQQLANSHLCIIKLDDRYELIPMVVAERIRRRDDSAPIISNPPTQAAAEDDPYKDYPIPDDLLW
jgi:uncharacterized protein